MVLPPELNIEILGYLNDTSKKLFLLIDEIYYPILRQKYTIEASEFHRFNSIKKSRKNINRIKKVIKFNKLSIWTEKELRKLCKYRNVMSHITHLQLNTNLENDFVITVRKNIDSAIIPLSTKNGWFNLTFGKKLDKPIDCTIADIYSITILEENPNIDMFSYSFALYPERHVPSGTVNYTQLHKFYLENT